MGVQGHLEATWSNKGCGVDRAPAWELGEAGPRPSCATHQVMALQAASSEFQYLRNEGI